MSRFAGVLFEVGSFDRDPRTVGQIEIAADVDRQVVLTDLKVFGHVGIEVVLTVKRRRRDRAVQGGADGHRQLDGAHVEYRKRSGQSQADRTDVGVRRGAEGVRAAAEHLGVGLELGVDLESDHHLPTVGQAHGRPSAISRTRAPAMSCASLRPGPSSCTPIGSPASPVPKGTEIAGSPERLLGMVKTSERYIAIGSAVFEPNSKATDGVVAPSRRSASRYARRKASMVSVRTFRACP